MFKNLFNLIVTVVFLTMATISCEMKVTTYVVIEGYDGLLVGDEVVFTAKDMLNILPSNMLTWTSDNPRVAEVDANGLVKAKSAGTTTVSVTTRDDRNASLTVVVSELFTGNETIVMTANSQWVDIALKGSGAATVDWGDGARQTETLSENDYTYFWHGYSNANAHVIKISGDNITVMHCENNAITRLVSRNTALKDLSCGHNQLLRLDVSGNTALTLLNCYYSQLTKLDISSNTALTYLDCSVNQLTSLDVSDNTAMTYFKCNNNRLTSLDVSSNTALTHLECTSNQFSTTALNALFGGLHSDTDSNDWWQQYTVFIGNNPGTYACNRSIATDKGWDVYD